MRAVLQLLFPLAPLVLVLGFLFTPLYPWHADPSDHPVYFTTPFFIIRSVIYLAVWSGLAWIFREPPAERAARHRIAALGCILHATVGTMAAIDWAMALEPHWESSQYGLIVIWGQMTGGLCLAVLIAGRTLHRVKDIASLLLGAVSMWLYLHLMQFIVLYAGDLPRETIWLFQRASDFWIAVAVLGFICHFLVPFFTLLNGRARNSVTVVTGMAALILVGHCITTAWLIFPAVNSQPADAAVAALMLLGIGGLGGLAARYLPRPWAARAS